MEGRAVGTIDFLTAFYNCIVTDNIKEIIMILNQFMRIVNNKIKTGYTKYIVSDRESQALFHLLYCIVFLYFLHNNFILFFILFYSFLFIFQKSNLIKSNL